MRIFNGFSDVSTVRFRVERRTLPLASAFGAVTDYVGAASGEVEIAVLGPSGNVITSLNATLDSGGRYTIYGFGSGDGRGIQVANEIGETNPTATSHSFRTIDLIEGGGTHFGLLRFQDELLSVFTSTPASGPTIGFSDTSLNSQATLTFIYTRQTTGQNPGGTPLGDPISFEIGIAAPVSLVLYGRAADVRSATLEGVYANLPG